MPPSAGFVDEQTNDSVSGRVEVVIDGPGGGYRNFMLRGTPAEEKSDADSGIHGKHRRYSKKARAVCPAEGRSPAGFEDRPDEAGLEGVLDGSAGIEFDPFLFRDLDGGSCFWIPAFPGFPDFDLKAAKSRKVDFSSVAQRFLHSFEQGSKRFLGLRRVMPASWAKRTVISFFPMKKPPSHFADGE